MVLTNPSHPGELPDCRNLYFLVTSLWHDIARIHRRKGCSHGQVERRGSLCSFDSGSLRSGAGLSSGRESRPRDADSLVSRPDDAGGLEQTECSASGHAEQPAIAGRPIVGLKRAKTGSAVGGDARSTVRQCEPHGFAKGHGVHAARSHAGQVCLRPSCLSGWEVAILCSHG